MISLRRLVPTLGAVATIAAMLGGCGGSSSPPPGLASVVPPNAIVYADATVRPEGATKSALESSLSKLLGVNDPGALITDRLDQSLSQDNLSYSKDIQPWLGQRAGVFFTSFGSNPQGAVVLETTDPQAALDTFRKAATAQHHHPQKSTYRGLDLETAGDTTYTAINDLVLAGTDADVKAAVDASKGTSLADEDSYSSALDPAPETRVFTVWADPSRVVDALVKEGQVTSAQADQITSQFGDFLKTPIAAWGEAANNYLALEVSAGGGASSTSSLISGFPDDSWLAFGVHDVAAAVEQSIAQAKTGSAAGVQGLAQLQTALSQLGLDPQNLGRWVGDVSGFVHGTSIFGLGAALVITTRDEQASAQTLAEIEKAFRKDIDVIVKPLGAGETGFDLTPRGAPLDIIFTQREGKVIIALGQESVDAVLNPSKTLADAPAFKSATGALGSGITPSFYIDFQPIAGLFELPGAITNPEFEQVKPYLDRLDYLVAGSGTSGDRVLYRLALGVQSGSGSGSGSVAAAHAPAYATVTP